MLKWRTWIIWFYIMKQEDCDVCDVCGEGHAIIHCPQLCPSDIRNYNLATRARLTLPQSLQVEEDADDHISVVARQALPAKMKLGPYEARRTTQHIDTTDGFILRLFAEDSLQTVTLDTTSEAECNWLCLVPTARTLVEQNCMATQIGSEVYYITLREVEEGQQLKVWYAPSYARKLGKAQLPDAKTRVLLGKSLSSLVISSTPAPLATGYDQVSGTFGLSNSILDTQIEMTNDVSYEKMKQEIDKGRVFLDAQNSFAVLPSTVAPTWLCPNKKDGNATALQNEAEVTAEKYDGRGATDGTRRSCRLTSKKFSALELLGLKHQKCETKGEMAHTTRKLVGKKLSSESNNLATTKRDKIHLKSSAAQGVKPIEQSSCFEKYDTLSPDGDVGNLPASRLESEAAKGGSSVCITEGFSMPASMIYNENWNAYKVLGTALRAELETGLVSTSCGVQNKGERSSEVKTFNNFEIHAGTNIELDDKFQVMISTEKNQLLPSVDLQPTYKLASEELKDIHGEVSVTKETLSRKAVSLDQKNMENESEYTLHTCKFCDKTFEKQSYMARHIQGHLNVFQCDKCDKKFSRVESLTSHNCQQNLPEEGKAHRCKSCGSTFRTEKYLVRHLATHREDFKCDNCGRSFSRKESLLQHLVRCHPAVFNNGRMPAYPCTQCTRVFAKEQSLQSHMKLHSDSFKCCRCAKAFSSAFSLARHSCVGDVVAEGMAQETDDGCFECKKCGKILSQRAALRRHLAAHEDVYSCTVCGKKHSRKEELRKHMLECVASAELKKSGVVECSICHQSFSELQQFAQHHREHTHPYKCDACGRFFLRQANRDDHRCTTSETGPAQCVVCQKRFSSFQYLQRHVAIHAKRKHICDRCGRRFSRIDYLHDHVCLDDNGKRVRVRRTRHSEEIIRGQNAVVCPVCGKNYASISNLNKHMKTHGEKKEVCDVCGKQFHLKVLLKEHIKYVHTDTYAIECPHCLKRMKSRNSLYGHIALFHPERSQKEAGNFKCDQCGKVFRQKGNLKKHELTHSDKHSYACKQCDKTFKFPEQMRRHELWHRHGTRHQCQLCDRQFVMEFELRKHVETFHGGAVFICKYCNVVCHHQQAIKRHLQRCHFDINEWQTAGPDFVKSMQVFNSTYVNVKRRVPTSIKGNQSEVGAGFISTSGDGLEADAVNAPEQPIVVAPDFTSAPGTLILANVQGLEQGYDVNGEMLHTAPTYVIQTAPDDVQFDPDTMITYSITEPMTGPPIECSQQSLVPLNDLTYADGMIQFPLSIAESSVSAMQGSEYIFVSILSNASEV